MLTQAIHVRTVLQILDEITTSIFQSEDRKSDEFIALRKGLGYCWSVAVAAFSDPGKSVMEKWLSVADKDTRWIMRENLKTNRLVRMDADWVRKCQSVIEA